MTIQKIKRNPGRYYAMSIAATWAGSGSLIVGMQMARQMGIIPFFLWALGNTLACIVFGLLARRIPCMSRVFLSKPARVIVGLMCCFQIWVNMQGIYQILSETMIGPRAAMIITYSISAMFLLMYLRNPLLRNVLTDNLSWGAVYGVMAVLLALCAAAKGTVTLDAGLTSAGIANGLTKAAMLIPGCFLYPVFWEMYQYNDENADGTRRANMDRCFVMGGLLFGLYLLGVFVLSWFQFSPVMELVKALLITLVSISTLSSFIYSIFVSFGKRLGAAVNVFSIAGWAYLIPLGVLGIWTKMAEVRLVLVGVMTLLALCLWLKEKQE